MRHTDGSMLSNLTIPSVPWYADEAPRRDRANISVAPRPWMPLYFNPVASMATSDPAVYSAPIAPYGGVYGHNNLAMYPFPAPSVTPVTTKMSSSYDISSK